MARLGRSCYSSDYRLKLRFNGRRGATRWARIVRRTWRLRSEVDVYLCPDCRGWHVTTHADG